MTFCTDPTGAALTAGPDAAASTSGRPPAAAADLRPAVREYLAARAHEFERIPAERREILASLAGHIAGCAQAGRPARMLFVCTHNSRRSHMAQIWCAAAAAYYRVPHVATYSGGTEATAFNPRAVEALRRAGLAIERTTDDDNPIYHVRFTQTGPALTAFSKKFDAAPNPEEGVCAVMVCSQADKTCANVPGAARRISLPYDDPKRSDGTPVEKSAYDERSREIAREMMYALSLLKAEK